MDSCLGKQLGNVDKGAAIFVLRRRIHHHHGAISKGGAE